MDMLADTFLSLYMQKVIFYIYTDTLFGIKLIDFPKMYYNFRTMILFTNVYVREIMEQKNFEALSPPVAKVKQSR